MRHPFFNILLASLVLFGCCSVAFAENPENASRHAAGAYASATFGNGEAYGEGTTGDKKMKGRAFEVRFGKTSELQVFSDTGFRNRLRFDVVHYNEGHPDNNHRDGFALQTVYGTPLTRALGAEIGIGPYFSMNTTKVMEFERNEQHLGLLVSVAALLHLDRWSPGAHLRFALNHVTMPGAHSSNALLIGLGKHFPGVPAQVSDAQGKGPLWLGLSAGNAKTNHGGTKAVTGFSIEAKKYYGQWAASVIGIVEGDDEVRVDRKGVGIQGWFVQPLDRNWTASAGIGPYLGTNKRGSDDPELHGLFTLQLDRAVDKTWKVFASFSRVTDFSEKNDRDLGRLGIMRQWGG